MSIPGTHPDPTDTRTLRPDLDPLEKKGTQFDPLECPQFDQKIDLPIAPSDALGIFTQFFLVSIVRTIVQNTNTNHIQTRGPLQEHARAHD
jgi:hypothetical protein